MARALIVVAVLAAAAPARAGDLFGGIETLKSDLHGPDAARRRDAVDKLDAYAADEARPILQSALDDGDLDVRVRAILSVARHQLGELSPRLVSLVEDQEPRLRAAAADALGQLGAAHVALDGKALGALARALGDSEPSVRQAAAIALGRLELKPAEAQAASVALAARLDDENAGVRQRACEVLGRLGDPRAVIPLLARLGDPSRDVRVATVEALGTLGDARAAPALIRLLGDPAEEVRAQAVQSLGRLRARAAVTALAEILERPPSATAGESLRGRAAFALGQIGQSEGGEVVVAPLLAALGRDELRPAAREALGRVGAAALQPLVARLPSANGDELGAIIELLGESGDARAAPSLLAELSRGRAAREKVIDALGAIARARNSATPKNGAPSTAKNSAAANSATANSAAANSAAGSDASDENAGRVAARAIVVELAGLLGDPDHQVRRHAALALRGAADRRAVAALAQAARDDDREVRLTAIAELGRLQASSALPQLERALESADGPTAAAAARALGELGDGAAGPQLVSALSRPDARLRREAADALGRLHDPASLAPLLQLARHAYSPERPDAVAALGGVLRGRPDAATREFLFGLLDGDAPSAGEALDALAASRDPACAPRLEKLVLRTEDPSLRRRALQAYGEVSPDAHLLLARLDGDPDPRVRAEAAWSLGKRKPTPAIAAALARALASPAAGVRANAAAALARLGEAPPALAHLLDDRDPAVRANAALALAHSSSARPALERLRSDDDRAVRAAAARALGGARPDARADWIALHLTDFDGSPLAGARFRLILPDALTKSAVADARGVAREEQLPRGACRVELDDEQPPK